VGEDASLAAELLDREAQAAAALADSSVTNPLTGTPSSTNLSASRRATVLLPAPGRPSSRIFIVTELPA
jgi:hypothetical protein